MWICCISRLVSTIHLSIGYLGYRGSEDSEGKLSAMPSAGDTGEEHVISHSSLSVPTLDLLKLQKFRYMCPKSSGGKFYVRAFLYALSP